MFNIDFFYIQNKWYKVIITQFVLQLQQILRNMYYYSTLKIDF